MRREEADKVTIRKKNEVMEKIRTEMERNNDIMEGVTRQQADVAATEKVYIPLQYAPKDSDTYDALVRRLLKAAEDGARYENNRSGLSAKVTENKAHGEDKEEIVNRTRTGIE